ncbi:hypothetical protein PBY51_024965 [Eleginops maclovinus]|uniref:Uncharacterized protein n=1 Tax=Eleginops maclovinus TaxID=56733 RepID=A0AAN7XUI9_ELEMC|nr:hypothetical protein PBY51_024965 [Eleginops maclovinus]
MENKRSLGKGWGFPLTRRGRWWSDLSGLRVDVIGQETVRRGRCCVQGPAGNSQRFSGFSLRGSTTQLACQGVNRRGCVGLRVTHCDSPTSTTSGNTAL